MPHFRVIKIVYARVRKHCPSLVLYLVSKTQPDLGTPNRSTLSIDCYLRFIAGVMQTAAVNRLCENRHKQLSVTFIIFDLPICPLYDSVLPRTFTGARLGFPFTASKNEVGTVMSFLFD